MDTEAGRITFEYQDFLESKRMMHSHSGMTSEIEISPLLFDFQRDITKWALKLGKAAIFADCGLGKTAIQLEWAKHVSMNSGPVLIVAPLAVSSQTEREGRKFGVDCKYSRVPLPDTLITVTNYEMLDRFDPSIFSGVVLDESSILKSHTGKFRNYIIDNWGTVPFRLAATATPAPNDFMELGNHSEFLGALSRSEMLSMFFVHDGGETQKWRLKGHATELFWEWVSNWSVMIRKPSELGYSDGNFILPKCNIHSIRVDVSESNGGFLFPMEAQTLQDRLNARRDSVQERCEEAARLVNSSMKPWLVWCNLNSESSLLKRMIPDSVEVKGSDSREVKEDRLIGFSEGKYRVMVTKPSIAGFGMNWQHCSNMAFVGLSDSYEQFYQALRRCWRFGQKSEVNAHVITAETEGAVVSNIKRKERDADAMAKSMAGKLKGLTMRNLTRDKFESRQYVSDKELLMPKFL